GDPVPPRTLGSPAALAAAPGPMPPHTCAGLLPKTAAPSVCRRATSSRRGGVASPSGRAAAAGAAGGRGKYTGIGAGTAGTSGASNKKAAYVVLPSPPVRASVRSFIL